MAELTTLARPYAKAAFGYALEKNNLGAWSTMLQWAAAIISHPDMTAALDRPELTAPQKARIVVDVCEGKLDEQSKNFIHVLAENKRLALLPEVAVIFEELKAEQEKTLDVDVESAFALTTEQIAALKGSLQVKLKRTIELACTVDQQLIGGLIIRAGDTVIDGSVRGKLSKLAEAMNS